MVSPVSLMRFLFGVLSPRLRRQSAAVMKLWFQN